jgi:anti-sigma factor RsiW
MTNHATDEELNDVVDAPHSYANQHVYEHVARCAECQREVASIRALIDRSRTLNDPITPPVDLWPGIVQAAPLVQRRVRRNRLSRLIPLAAAIAFAMAGASLGYYLADARYAARGTQQEAGSTIQATTASAIPDAPLLQRAAVVIGDSALYEQRLRALADSLTLPDRAAMAASPSLAVRRNEIDSLTKLVTADRQNSALANALSRALDGWYFDVQQLRREVGRR